eukprot:TRINITY_DN1502_c1_g4_i1.p1 TRINITY_DN1502_c1_g4~~TRINITY_DN1502_c1_g4_i1.p1  ORF type:complete len:547 (+),score=51.00 TRINITY_DN1502_c1_g4_i1:68-1708(+)
MSSPNDYYFVLFASLILCVALGIRTWECMPTLSVPKLSPCRVGSDLRRFFKIAFLMEVDEPVDAIHSYAAGLLHSEQLSYARLICFLFPVLASALSLLRNGWLYTDNVNFFYLSGAQHAVLCIAAGSFVLVRILMSWNLLSTKRLAERVYLCACLFIDAMVVVSSDSRNDVEYTTRLGHGLRAVFLFARLDTHLVAFWNVVSAIIASVKYSMTEADTVREDMPTLQYVGSVLSILALITYASHQVYACTRESALNEARAKESNVEQGALGKLLENACDVVVSLDASFSMLDDARSLLSMLMRDSSRSLQGRSIFDYIANEEDKERLQASLKAKSSTLEPRVSALNLRMRDSRGGEVSFESMGVAFRHVDGTESYKIGLREISDFLPRSIRGLREDTLAPAEVPREEVRVGQASCSRGTPATIMGQPIPRHAQDPNDPDACSSSSRSHRSCGQQQLASPLWKETTEEGKFESIFWLIGSWNCKLPPGCCSLHRTASEVKRMLKTISKMKCNYKCHEPRNQCTACGLLNSYEEDLICSICHHDESLGL